MKEHKQWLEERKKYVTASDVPAVLGLNPYKKPIEVYQEKIGVVPPFRGNEHTERGKRMEPIILDFLEKSSPDWKITRNNLLMRSSAYPFLAATPDALGWEMNSKGHFPIEVKCPKNPWREVPSYYRPQLWAQMIALGAEHGYFVWACDSTPLDLHSIIILKSHFSESNQWLEKLERFHKCVLARALFPEFW